eukprot:evm.model.scf_2052.1 EVM.evm.TU.scf_2052.1   scf_2052:4104-6685(-)
MSTAGHALCPYRLLWMPDSPMKLPDDHPALRGAIPDPSSLPVASRSGRPSGAYPAVGAGCCTHRGSPSPAQSCVQFTGKAWADDPVEAAAWCDRSGGTFLAGEMCHEFSDPDFAGICVTAAGEAEELGAVMLGGWDSSACEALRMGCEEEDGRAFVGAGESCGGSGEVKERNASAACQMAPGVPGGGHMDKASYWDADCENQDNEFAMPLRWAADMATILVQKQSRQVGSVYYDLRNNRKRQDVMVTGGYAFSGNRNSTVIHDHGVMRIMNWDTGICVKFLLPMGNLRPNWVLDGHGAGTESQYIGPQYIWYNGDYRIVKQWRKIEPLENAFMIQSYDQEGVWETPEGPKRKVLMRETPGAPGEGDAIDLYFNHTTDFDDSVFDVLDAYECFSVGSAYTNSDGARESTTDVGGAVDASTVSGTHDDQDSLFGGLNTNTSLRVDSGFIPVECKECGLNYSDDSGKGNGSHPHPSGNATYFSGRKVIRQEAFLEMTWEYDPDGDMFSFSLRSERDGGWLGVTFPKYSCSMVPAEGVIATPSADGSGAKVASYQIRAADLSGIVQDDGQALQEAGMTNEDGVQVLSFKRRSYNGGKMVLDPTGPINVLWATGSNDALGYHGLDGRGCFTINERQRNVEGLYVEV